MLPVKNIRVRKLGNSYFILVPKSYIDNGLIDTNKEYHINIKEVEKDENNSNP